MVENRALRRQPVQWPVTISDARHHPGLPILCHTLDLNVHGVTILCDRNVFVTGPVLARLHVPPLSVYLRFETFEIQAQVVYTLFSSAQRCFRSGLRFESFIVGTPEGLQRTIEAHVSPI